MSDSVRPHRQQPNRLCRPWDSPAKNIGVGYHFLLQCMKVKSESDVTQSCPTLPDPLDCSLPGSFVHVIFQARVLEWGAIAFSSKVGYLQVNRCIFMKIQCAFEGGNRTGPILKAGLHLGPDCGLWAICPI